MSMTLSSIRIAVRIVCCSFAWSSSHVALAPVPWRFMCASRLIEPRLHTAISVTLVLSVISVHRFELCTVPTCCCGERTLHASLNVIHGCPVSNSIESILRQSCTAGIFLWTLSSPRAAFHHALHEQVWNPVRRVHVVRAAAVVARVLAQLEELLDVVVPRLEVRADGALPFSPLVDRDGRVVDDLQERDHALALAV